MSYCRHGPWPGALHIKSLFSSCLLLKNHPGTLVHRPGLSPAPEAGEQWVLSKDLTMQTGGGVGGGYRGIEPELSFFFFLLAVFGFVHDSIM